MPKQLLLLILCVGAMLGSSGCIQMEHELQIQANGSAVYRLNYAISEQAITQFRAMLKLRRDLAVAAGEDPEPNPHPLIMTLLDPSVTAIREHLLAWEPQGVTIRSLRQNTRTLWRDFALVLDIADLAKLPEIPFFAKQGFTLQQTPEGQYVLERPALVTDANSIPPRFTEPELAQIRPFLDGFKTEIKIQVPGRIVSTTANRTSLQTAIWSYDFNLQPESLQQLLRQHIHLVFQTSTRDLPEFTLP